MRCRQKFLVDLLSGLFFATAASAEPAVRVSVDWSHTIAVSKTIPTIIACPFRPTPGAESSNALHQQTEFDFLRKLDSTYVRWHLINPERQIPELYPPTPNSTSWDFSRLDADVIPFLEATKARDPIINLTGIPYWMFKTGRPIPHSDIPDDPDLRYQYWEGTQELVDPTGKALAGYYARIASWYTQGGFTDENGTYHRSGYHYELPWWGVLNEVDVEFGGMTPQEYTRRYDAIVAAVHKVSPRTKFIGPSLGLPSLEPEFFEYFLNPKNHRPGTPLDMMGYHFYAGAGGLGFSGASETISEWQYTYFDHAAAFLSTVRYVESIRKRLSPQTRVDLDELGALLGSDILSFQHPEQAKPIPALYWNLNGSVFAYLYVQLAKMGIDVATISGIYDLPHGYPGHLPSITFMDPATGALHAPAHLLELIKDHFGPGDKLVLTSDAADPFGPTFPEMSSSDVLVQAFVTSRGRKLLAVNKRLREIDVDLSGIGAIRKVEVVDAQSGDGPPRLLSASGSILHLQGFAVAVVEFQ